MKALLFVKAMPVSATYRIEEPTVAVAHARTELDDETRHSNNAIMPREERTNPRPTEAQKASGDYDKRKVGWQGLTVAIESEAGTVRSGTNRDGETWSTTLKYPYGYIQQSTGMDGEEVDVFLGPDEDAQMVYVVHARKVNRWDEFDEDKVMLNFPTEEAAAAAFLECYSDPRFLGPITAMPVIEFVQKVQNTKDRPTMIKAFIKGYTRKDGVYVPPHQDNRRAKTASGAVSRKAAHEIEGHSKGALNVANRAPGKEGIEASSHAGKMSEQAVSGAVSHKEAAEAHTKAKALHEKLAKTHRNSISHGTDPDHGTAAVLHDWAAAWHRERESE